MTDDATNSEPVEPAATPPQKPASGASDAIKKAAAEYTKTQKAATGQTHVGKITGRDVASSLFNLTPDKLGLNISDPLTERLRNLALPSTPAGDFTVAANPSPHLTAEATARTAENTETLADMMVLLVKATVNEAEKNEQARTQQANDRRSQEKRTWAMIGIAAATLAAAILGIAATIAFG